MQYFGSALVHESEFVFFCTAIADGEIIDVFVVLEIGLQLWCDIEEL